MDRQTPRRRRGFALLLVLVLSVAACRADGRPTTPHPSGARRPDVRVRADAHPPTPAGKDREPRSGPARLPSPPSRTPCRGGHEAEIAAIEIPAVHVAPLVVPGQQLAGHHVPGFRIAGVDVPARTIPAACVRYDDAPAGCLGAVTIPAISIPAVTLPAVTIPPVDAGAIHAPAVHRPAVTVPALVLPERRRAAVCAPRTTTSGVRAPIVQLALWRSAALRQAVTRGTIARRRVCDGGDCLPAVAIGPVTIDAVVVPAVGVPGRSLDVTELPEVRSGCVTVRRGIGETVYELCADVLFAFDRASIRPRAAHALREVAASIVRRFPGRVIRVEGHTDASGSRPYNRRLSARRAAAVKRWLIEQGGLPAERIATRGYGESVPVATNGNPAGRARNRRVVIGIAAA